MKTSLTTIFLLISILCFTQLENYYENGQVKTSLVRENDLVKTTSYYQNGNIRDVGYFDLDDRRQVKWKEYYENGNLREKKNYNKEYLSEIDLEKIVEKWSPYKTTASLLLWKSIEEKIFYSK